jgi:hypothetical protein
LNRLAVPALALQQGQGTYASTSSGARAIARDQRRKIGQSMRHGYANDQDRSSVGQVCFAAPDFCSSALLFFAVFPFSDPFLGNEQVESVNTDQRGWSAIGRPSCRTCQPQGPRAARPAPGPAGCGVLAGS